MSKPLVSISCLTYNHVNYIKDTIEGFLMQKTNFDFEILIHDDASTDGTTEIIKEYANNYPEIIKPLYETENQWQKGRRGSVVFNFPRARGKYIALCEGDDYWIDPYKLQKQVDFLEENEEVNGCGTYTDILRYGKLEKKTTFTKENIYFSDIMAGKKSIPTLTLMFRNAINYQLLLKYKIGDLPLLLLLTKNNNNVIKLPFSTAVYRYNGKGVNSGNTRYANIKSFLEVREQFIKENNLVNEKSFFNEYLLSLIKSEIVRILKLRNPSIKLLLTEIKHLINLNI